MSNKWNRLPNDILEKILEQVRGSGRRHYLHKCLLVNKQWFKLAHPKLYEEIYIHLNKEKNKLLYTLVASIYQPGVWVKTINLLQCKKIQPSKKKKKKRADKIVDMFQSSGIIKDSLDLLISQCPNVRKLCVPLSGIIDWKHLSEALLQTNGSNSWNKLEFIPEYTFEDENYGGFDNYYNCVYHCRDSLKEFTINKYMNLSSNKNRLHRFRDFLRLTYLKVEEHAVKDMFELQDLLVYFPHLISIAVNVASNGFDTQKSYSRQIDNCISQTRVQEMKLTQYVASGAEELLVLTRFKSLEHLTILPPRASRFNRMPSSIKVSTILEFLQFAHTQLSTYHLGLNKLKTGDVRNILINMYHVNGHAIQQSTNSTRTGNLYINFDYIDYSTRDEPLVDMIVSKEQRENDMVLNKRIELTYDVESIVVTEEHIDNLKDLILKCSKYIPKNNIHIVAPPFYLECLNQNLWCNFYMYISKLATLDRYLPYY